MIRAVSVIAAYIGAMWWLMDRGRTPVLAIIAKKLAGCCGTLAVHFGQYAWDLDRAAYALIRKRSLA